MWHNKIFRQWQLLMTAILQTNKTITNSTSNKKNKLQYKIRLNKKYKFDFNVIFSAFHATKKHLKYIQVLNF